MNKIVIFHGRYTLGYFKPESGSRGNAATGEFTEIGVTRRFTKRINPNLMDIRGTGSNKRKFHPPGIKEFDFGVEYYIQNTNFLKELITPTTPAIGTSTIEIRDSGDGSTYKFWFYTGVVLDNFSVTTRVGDPLVVSADGGAMDLSVNSSTSITDPTPSTVEPWVWNDGSVKIGSSDAPEVIEYTCNVKHNAERRYNFSGNKPTDNITNDFHADGTIVLTTEYGTGDYIGDLIGDVQQDIIFYLKDTASYITVVNAKFSRLDNPSEAGSVLTETFAFEGLDATVTG